MPHLAVLHEDGAKAAARAVLETLLKIDGKGGKEGGREGGRDNRVRGCGDGGGTRFPVRHHIVFPVPPISRESRWTENSLPNPSPRPRPRPD